MTDYTPKKEPYYDIKVNPSLDLYNKRIGYLRNSSLDRMTERKRKTLRDALLHPYYGANVVDKTLNTEYRAVIYPKREGYEDISTEKIFSTYFKNQPQVGNIIYWEQTDTYWLIYQQNESEITYFEGNMQQCSPYTISNPLVGDAFTYASIAVEEESSHKMFDETLVSNDTTILKITIPDNSLNRDLFQISSKIEIDKSFWKIISINWLSTKGVIKIKAKKDYDMSDEQIIAFREEHTPIENDNTYIDGLNEIYPEEEIIYKYTGSLGDDFQWSVDNYQDYITTFVDENNDFHICWTKLRKHGSFNIVLKTGNKVYSKSIKVKSFM